MTHAICDESIELENEVISNDRVQGFNGSAVCVTSKGDLKVKDNSTGCVIELKNARKSKKIKKNIISIGQLQDEGWTLRGSDNILVTEKEDRMLRFEKSDEEKNRYYMDATVVSKAQVYMKERTFNLAVETAIFLNDIAPTARNKIPAYILWNKMPSPWKVKDLKEFGRIGIVKIKDKYVKKKGRQ